LLYDVLQRRQAALGNSILVKRKDWETAQAAISSLTFDRLEAAAKSVHETNTHNDPSIRLLERHIQSIAAQVPQSFALMRSARVHMRALFLSHGMAGVWLTINPADLTCPMVLTLAGVTLSSDELTTEARRIRRLTAQMNPVAVAQFFHHICVGLFDALLAAGKGKMGILGEVSNYFGVVETNGRGMLHLHTLVWLAGNLEFFTLRDRLQCDPVFASKMIRYISSIIRCSIDAFTGDHDNVVALTQAPSARGTENDRAFAIRLHQDADSVACRRQMHSEAHNPTCFKYAKEGSRVCRFNFPRPLVPETHVNSHGVIEVERNNQWVTPWNPTLSSVLRSNHDINFVPTLTMAFSAVYYMTNYATKHDVSQYQLILSAAILKRALEDAKAAADPSETQLRIRRLDMDKFALQSFNRLSNDREISGPQAASSLLGLPDSYTLPTTIRRLNLRHLRHRLDHVLAAEAGTFLGEDEQARVNIAKKAPTTFFEHYRWRGPSFSTLCLYEYVKLVVVKTMASATSADIPFLPEHPRYETHVQNFSERRAANDYSVAFNSSVSENQRLEDSVRGGHPTTDSMQNDLALGLLALLVPWERLPPLFTGIDCGDGRYIHHCAKVWDSIKLSLPPHLQDVARNCELLRKCKADAQVDAALRREARRAASSHDNIVSDSDDDDSDDGGIDDVDQTAESSDQCVSLDTLYQAFSIVKGKWAESDRRDADNIPSLRDTDPHHVTADPGAASAFEDFTMSSGDSASLATSSDFHRISPDTLQQWRQRLSGDGSEALADDFNIISEGEDSDDDAEQLRALERSDDPGPLHPIPDRVRHDVDPTVLQQISRLGPNPTGTSVADLVRETLPLNEKQYLVVKKILTHAIQHHGKSTLEAEDQMLLAVAGEGGVGKTRVIQAVELGFELLQRKDEVLLLAPTGAAAYNIGGRTIHTALGIDLFDRARPTVKSQTYSLWRGKTTLFIDEISMVSLTMLNTINQQCNKIRAVGQDSTAILGALPIVVFMGDFHQFAPISAQPLWQTPKNPRASLGQLIWHRFTDVVILDEQMRQHDDLEFQGLLRRARAGTITTADVDALNARVMQSLPPCDGVDSVCVTRTNKRRHHINRLQMRRFAEARGQDIYVFPAAHTRTKKKHRGLRVDELLGTQDGEGTAKGPGLFLYTKGMPVTILYNISTPLGLVNGARGTAAGIVMDPECKIFFICLHNLGPS
jgi:helitron helicase-like protein/PIF1-like helicase